MYVPVLNKLFKQIPLGFKTCYLRRGLSADSCKPRNKGLVVGVYNCDEELRLTPVGERINEEASYRLAELIKGSGLKKGKALAFERVTEDFAEVAVAGLGPEDAAENPLEGLEARREAVRVAAGEGARLLQQRGCNEVLVEDFSDGEAAAEGAGLAVWKRDQGFGNGATKVSLYGDWKGEQGEAWERGSLKAEAQNVARGLAGAPPNLMTPAIFAQSAVELLCGCGIGVEVRGSSWIEGMRMNALLATARSSCQPPYFLEMSYNGAGEEARPIVLVGKGLTFEAGGLNLRDRPERDGSAGPTGEVSGGAAVVGAIKAAAELCLPISIKGLVPLCESMVGGLGLKPGDVILGMNGKTLRIESGDTEGKAMLADALSYSSTFNPCLVINVADIATGLSGVLGEPCSGVFSTSHEVWNELRSAGSRSGDRLWRLPLWSQFTKKVTDYVGVDVNNVVKGSGGDPCIGAAFLMEFVPPVDFVHVDISSVWVSGGGIPYLRKGTASGRPTRTLTEFLQEVACNRKEVPQLTG